MLLAVSPAKDVDAFHPENVGRLVQGRPRFLPCTPQGVQQLLVRNGIEIAGRHVVILGRSEIVGRPLSIMLSQRGPSGDATVTVCHSRTRDLAAVTRTADILVVAIGQPKFVTAEMVKPGADGRGRGHQSNRRRRGWRRRFRGRGAKWPGRSRPCPAASGRSRSRCCCATRFRRPNRWKRKALVLLFADRCRPRYSPFVF